MKTVKIYSADYCMPCKMLKKSLTQKNIPYENYNSEDFSWVTALPTIQLVENDEVVETINGSSAKTVAKIEEFLNVN